MKVRVKLKLDAKRFKWIEIEKEKLHLVIENNREVSKYEKREIRHESMYSLDELNENFELEDDSPTPLEQIIAKEDEAEKMRLISLLPKAIMQLTQEQQQLIHKVFYEGITQREVAESEGVLETAISMRMSRIYSRLKKILKII